MTVQGAPWAAAGALCRRAEKGATVLLPKGEAGAQRRCRTSATVTGAQATAAGTPFPGPFSTLKALQKVYPCPYCSASALPASQREKGGGRGGKEGVGSRAPLAVTLCPLLSLRLPLSPPFLLSSAVQPAHTARIRLILFSPSPLALLPRQSLLSLSSFFLSPRLGPLPDGCGFCAEGLGQGQERDPHRCRRRLRRSLGLHHRRRRERPCCAGGPSLACSPARLCPPSPSPVLVDKGRRSLSAVGADAFSPASRPPGCARLARRGLSLSSFAAAFSSLAPLLTTAFSSEPPSISSCAPL